MAVSFNDVYLTHTSYETRLGWCRATGGGVTYGSLSHWSGYIDIFDDSPTVDDCFYIRAQSGYFTGWRIQNSATTWMSSVSHTIVWEYYNGSAWTTLPSISDGTNGFTQAGYISWAMPADWARYDIQYSSPTQHHKYYWVRARLSALDTVTEGGQIYTPYLEMRPCTIFIGGDSVTPASLLASSVAGGWNAVRKEGNRYVFPYGMYSSNNATIFTVAGEDLQFGETTNPCFFFNMEYSTWKVNNSATYSTSSYITTVDFYAEWRGSYGIDYFQIYFNNANTILANVSFKIHANNFSGDRPYYYAYRYVIYGGNYAASKNYNCIFNSGVIQGSSNFERCNFPSVNYVLTTSAAVYKNCYFGCTFNVDPGQCIVVEDSTFTGSTTSWRYMYFPAGAYYHYFEVTDCSFPNNNEYTDVHFESYPTEDRWARRIHSHKFDLKVVDEDGTALQGATVKLVDTYGYNQLWVATSLTTSATANLTTTSITISDASTISAGDYLKIAEEAMYVVSKSTNTLTVTREQLGTKAYGFTASGVKIFKLYPTATTDANGQISQCKINKLSKFRNGTVAAGMTTLTHSPYTLTISKSGYETYTSKFTLSAKASLTITLKRAKPVLMDDNGNTFINIDKENISDSIIKLANA